MTLAEKLGQLSILSADYAVTGPVVPTNVDADVRAGRVGSLFNLWGREAVREAQRIAVEETRLGIPLFFALDVIHGFRTVFPIPLAEAGAFDPALWEATARAAAAETTAAGIDLTFAPMLDVARDPRWGRIAEGPGEDPYVAATFATAKVRGYQGRRPRHHAQALRRLRHQPRRPRLRRHRGFPPHPRRGLPPALPRRRRRRRPRDHARLHRHRRHPPDRAPRPPHRPPPRHWGFDGVVISDYTAINELVTHGVAADAAEAAALALNAGVDIDMMSRAYERALPHALDRGLVTMETIDAAVARVLTLKERLGLLDDPSSASAPPTPTSPHPRRRPRRREPLDRPPAQPRRHPPAARRPRSSPSSAPSPTPPARCSAPGPAPAAARRPSRSAPASPPPSPARIPFAGGCPIDRPDEIGIPEAVALVAEPTTSSSASARPRG